MVLNSRFAPARPGVAGRFSFGETTMNSHKNEADLAQMFDKLFPLEPGEKVPMPRFGRTKPPPAQPLPPAGPQNAALAETAPVPLQWIDDDLGLRVFIEYEAEPGLAP